MASLDEECWQRLLVLLSEQYGVEPATIQPTAAWQRFRGSCDPLDAVEMIFEIEDELDRAADGRD
jgi:hypothetical protein